MVIMSCHMLTQSFVACWAGILEIFWGSVKTLKHSKKSSLIIKDGSKVIVLSCSLALQFCSFHWCVNDRLLCLALGSSRFHSGVDACSLASASLVQSCRWTQSLSLSSLHVWQVQKFIGLWSFSFPLILVEVFIRLAIVFTLCFFRRHFAALLLIGLGLDPIWSQAGISFWFL